MSDDVKGGEGDFPGARIYNMDAAPVECCQWTELPLVKVYHDFFKRYEDDFQ